MLGMGEGNRLTHFICPEVKVRKCFATETRKTRNINCLYIQFRASVFPWLIKLAAKPLKSMIFYNSGHRVQNSFVSK